MTEMPVGRNHAPLEPLIDVIGVGASRTIGPITVTLSSVERYATGFRAVTGDVVRREHPIASAIAREVADDRARTEQAHSAVERNADAEDSRAEAGGWVGYVPHRSQRLVWAAHDDADTVYEGTMGGGHGGGMPDPVWRMEEEFRPGIPADARRLTLAAMELRWYEHDLEGRRFAFVRTDSGPWTFAVELPPPFPGADAARPPKPR